MTECQDTKLDWLCGTVSEVTACNTSLWRMHQKLEQEPEEGAESRPSDMSH